MPIPLARFACAVLVIAFAQPAWAQPAQPQGQHQGQQPGGDPQRNGPPPPNAYTDCKGKKAGDTVQHATPRGTGPATCIDSPEGLVARPNPPPGPPPAVQR